MHTSGTASSKLNLSIQTDLVEWGESSTIKGMLPPSPLEQPVLRYLDHKFGFCNFLGEP